MKNRRNILKMIFCFIALLGLLFFTVLSTGCSPEVQVGANVTGGQVPLTVTFTNTSKNADEFQWDFGDGTKATSNKLEPVTHEYTKAGTHNVTMTAIKKGNPPKTNTISRTISVEHGPLDHVKIIPENAQVTVNQTQKFTAQALDAYNNPIPEAQLAWTFAEGMGDFTAGVLMAGTKTGFFPKGITVVANLNSHSAKGTVYVTIRPGPVALVKLNPKTVQVYSGERQKCTAEAFDSYGNPIPEAQISWDTAPGSGKIDSSGTFTAGTVASIFSKGLVATAKLNGYSAQATGSVTVDANVALNSAVTLHGGKFFEGGWPGGLVVEQTTVMDGVFLPRNKQWNQGSVWWDARDNVDRHLVIDLKHAFKIKSFTVQADNNDTYLLYYWDLTSNRWQLAWDVPPTEISGMQTRPSSVDDTKKYELPNAIITNALLLRGDLQSADRLFSVSEIQVFGHPVLDSEALPMSVPEPWIKSSLPPKITLGEPFINGLNVTLNGVTLPGMHGAAVSRIHWDWGDGTSGDNWFPASHTYDRIGSYIVTVTSYQSDGLSLTSTKAFTLTTSSPAITGVYKWSVPTNLAPFTDARIREAISLLLDEENLTAGLIPGKTVQLKPEQEFASEKYNLDRAKRLLWEAGYPNGFRMSIYAAPDSDQVKTLASAVSESLKKAGIVANLMFYQRAEEIPRVEFGLVIKPAS